MAQQEVFISYAWGGESENVANEIEAKLASSNLHLIRDKSDLGFKGLIREFMERIGQGNLVVLIISDRYLKSKNCMFELLEVVQKGEFHNRVFPVVLPDADIYDSLGIINYLKYWDQKIKDLNVSVRELDNLADTRKVLEDIDLFTDIRGAIDDLAGKLSNMNTLAVEIMRGKHYQPLVEALQKQSGIQQVQPQIPNQPAKKQGKVLYHIPRMMQVAKWTKCTVRLAWEELLLTEGLNIPEAEQVIESIRLGNVMQVALMEGMDGQNFEIKSRNHEEQVIFEDEFTEWLFDVKPLKIGNFLLILRVTLIQIIEGKERKKDIVLERNVVTEAMVPEALTRFETAQEGLAAPKVEREGAKPLDLESLSKSSQPEIAVYPELSLDDNQPPIAPRPANRTTEPSPSLASPSRSQPSSSSQPAPKAKSTTFRKILPYAASLTVLVVIGTLFLPRFNSQSLEQVTTSDPNEEWIVAESPAPASDDKVILILANTMHSNQMEQSTPQKGIRPTKLMLFIVDKKQLDSLSKINFGSFSVDVIPTSDTLNYNLGVLKGFSVKKIQDSVESFNEN